MNNDKYQAAKREVHAADLIGLRDQIPALRRCQEELAHAVAQRQEGRETATIIYAVHSLDMLTEMHASAVQALAQDHPASGLMLAQTAIRLAVNTLYVLGDPGGDRLTGALRHHLDARLTWTAEWLKAAPKDAKAQEMQAHLAASCRIQPWYAEAPDWPSLGTRADTVGWGEWLYPILSCGVDAEQQQAQELLNVLECSKQGGQDACAVAHRYRLAKHGSDAVYLEGIALWVFADAVRKVAVVRQDKVAATIAESVSEQLDSLLDRHHQLAAAHRKDENLYIRVGG